MSSPTTDSTAPLALVTGASTGIGRALAAELVQQGFDVVVAADEPEIETAARELSSGGRQVTPVRADLSTAEGVERLYAEATSAGRPLHAVCLNAGIGVHGRFDQTEVADHLRLVDLNCRSVVHLAHLVLQDMVDRGEGHVLMTASIAAKAPGPWHSTYAASKAFVHSFAEGIRHELADTGVNVTSLLPGPTDTEFFDRADMQDTVIARGPKDSPDKVAADGVGAMLDEDSETVGGSALNRLATLVSGFVPDRMAGRIAGVETKPRGD